jgi:hypothetical protein
MSGCGFPLHPLSAVMMFAAGKRENISDKCSYQLALLLSAEKVTHSLPFECLIIRSSGYSNRYPSIILPSALVISFDEYPQVP